MPGIFISYRREDTSGYAGRLFDILVDRFGREHTFIDLDTIQGGDDFTLVIEERVTQCDVLLAVIGPKWLTCVGADGVRRLDQPRDFVRLEIAKAIDREVRVIPVLVGGGTMPPEDELPPGLQPLALRQAVELRDAYFRPDTERLIGLLSAVSPPRRKPQRRGSPTLWAVGALLVIALLVVGLLLYRRGQPAAIAVHPQASVPASREPVVTPPVREAPGAKVPRASTASAKVVETRPAKPAAFAGKWKATVTYDWPGAVYAETFDLQVDGTEVSGTASLLGAARGIVTGKIDGERVSFTTKSETELSDRIYQEKHMYKGTLSGDTIHFSMLTDSELESHVPIYFEAKRVAVK